MEGVTYLCIYEGSQHPFTLSKYVTDHIILRKIIRQTFVNGIGSNSNKAKKYSWSPFPIVIRAYRMTKFNEVEE